MSHSRLWIIKSMAYFFLFAPVKSVLLSFGKSSFPVCKVKNHTLMSLNKYIYIVSFVLIVNISNPILVEN